MPSSVPDWKNIYKAHELSKTGLSQRAIARAMKRDEKQIRRWLGYSADKAKKLSTT